MILLIAILFILVFSVLSVTAFAWYCGPETGKPCSGFYPICIVNQQCNSWGNCIGRIQYRNCNDGCYHNETQSRNCGSPSCLPNSQCPTSLTLTSSPAWTVINGTQTNVSCFADNVEVNISLFRNSTLIGSSVNGMVSDVQTLAVGAYSYVCNNSYTQNYTNASLSNILTISTKIPSTCSLTFNLSSPQIYGTAINASCSCTNSESSAKLYRNGLDVTSSENNQLITLETATYDYVCNVTETQNYTSAQDTSTFTISQYEAPIDNCSVLDQEGNTYLLTTDVIDYSSGTCMSITKENITFDCDGHTLIGSGTDYGVEITGKNVTVKNCNIIYWYDGLYSHDTNYTRFINNTLSNNTDCGINFSNGYYCTIENNTGTNNSIGIGLYTGRLCNITNNTIENTIVGDNGYAFHIFQYSDNNTFTNNKVNSNYNGFAIILNFYNNITNNIVNSNTNGFYLYTANSTIIQNNIISNNNYGIKLLGNSGNNIITFNKISDSIDSGISITNSAENLIYNNLFNNTNNYEFNSHNQKVNRWNTTQQPGTRIYSSGNIGGNYWTNSTANDYSDTCIDSDMDGICNDLYQMNANNKDYLPLSNKYPPLTITIDSPTNTTYDYTNILVNISSYGVNISNIWYNWNNTNVTYITPIYVNFTEGSIVLHVWVNDTTGNVNSTSVTFTVNITTLSVTPTGSNVGSFFAGGGGESSLCKENWTCTDWFECIAGNQNRTCIDQNRCGTIKIKPNTSQICNVIQQLLTSCKEDWFCTNWSNCINNTQTRTCIDKNKCGTAVNKTAELQTCTSVVQKDVGTAPTGFFLSLSANEWIEAIVAGIVIALIIIFIFFKNKK